MPQDALDRKQPVAVFPTNTHNIEHAPPSKFVGTFDEAIERFESSGFMLARLETLMKAGRDKRLDRAALEVLICLIEALNKDTLTCFLGRDSIAAKVGISPKSVSNYLWQLRALGYITSGYRQTPEANNRSLLHYTLTALKPEEIEEAITRAVASVRGERTSVVALPTSRPDRNTGSRPDGKPAVSSRPSGKSTSCPDGNSEEGSRPDRNTGSRPDGCSNTTSPTTPVEQASSGLGASPSAQPNPDKAADPKRGTRLPPDWRLPRAWGEWALEHFDVTAAQVRAEAERFRNHWQTKSGKDAAKLDWRRTWENWCSSSYTRWKRKRVDADIAPDLPDDKPKLKLSRW